MEKDLNAALENEKIVLETKRIGLEQEIARLKAEMDETSFRLGHVNALLKGSEVSNIDEEKKSAESEPGTAKPSQDPVEIAYQILEEHGTEPVYYRDLVDIVKERGGNIEGTDPALTLVSKLVEDERFVRPFRRGWYALRVNYPKAKNVGARKNKSMKHRGRR
jgi:hypothetical protein